MTALITCDQQISAFTEALGTATPEQLAALAAALTAAGVGGSTGGGSPSGAAGGGLTGTYPNPGLSPAAVASALATSGVGTGTFISIAPDLNVPADTDVQVASWTAPRAGKVSVGINAGMLTTGSVTDVGYEAFVKKGGTYIAFSAMWDRSSGSFPRYSAPTATNNYVEVAAGDILTGFVKMIGVAGKTYPAAFALGGAFGLSVHYFA